MGSPTEIRYGVKADAGEIASLVNSAYRGESGKCGWTTEADHLGGQRTDTGEVSRLIESVGSFFLLCIEAGTLVGVIHLEQCGEDAKLGMLAVRPDRQGSGFGRRLLIEAERTAVKAFGAGKIKMAVLTFRTELIAYYKRRGYSRTGHFEDFPADPKFGIPKVSGLRFEWLEKPVRG
ncbi:MAG: GNAT family N-acetyltransferase [Burkholderiales bacterium]